MEEVFRYIAIGAAAILASFIVVYGTIGSLALYKYGAPKRVRRDSNKPVDDGYPYVNLRHYIAETIVVLYWVGIAALTIAVCYIVGRLAVAVFP